MPTNEHHTDQTPQEEARIVDDETVFICAEDLAVNYFNLKVAGEIPKWGGTILNF
jgi:hypothetical protein